MKSTSKQDLYLYEQVETVLRDSIPQISKNIHESFKTKPAGRFKQFLDRVSLAGQQALYTAGSGVLKNMLDVGKQETIKRKEEHDKRINSVVARELGMKEGELKGILDTPKNQPQVPKQTIELIHPTTGVKTTVQNPLYAAERKEYNTKLSAWRTREKLVNKMNAVKSSNPFISSADTTASREQLRSKKGADFITTKAIPFVQRKMQQIRQERINRGYTT